MTIYDDDDEDEDVREEGRRREKKREEGRRKKENEEHEEEEELGPEGDGPDNKGGPTTGVIVPGSYQSIRRNSGAQANTEEEGGE